MIIKSWAYSKHSYYLTPEVDEYAPCEKASITIGLAEVFIMLKSVNHLNHSMHEMHYEMINLQCKEFPVVVSDIEPSLAPVSSTTVPTIEIAEGSVIVTDAVAEQPLALVTTHKYMYLQLKLLLEQ